MLSQQDELFVLPIEIVALTSVTCVKYNVDQCQRKTEVLIPICRNVGNMLLKSYRMWAILGYSQMGG